MIYEEKYTLFKTKPWLLSIGTIMLPPIQNLPKIFEDYPKHFLQSIFGDIHVNATPSRMGQEFEICIMGSPKD